MKSYIPSFSSGTETPGYFDNFYGDTKDISKLKPAEEREKEQVSAWSAFKTGAIKFWGTDSIKYLSKGFNKAISSIQSELSTILGPLQGVISSVWDMAKGIGGFFTSAFSDVKGLLGFGGDSEDDESKSDNKRNKLLTKLINHFKDESKRQQLEGYKDDIKPKTFWFKAITAALFTIGLIIGGFARSLILPFEVLYKALKLIPGVATLFSKIGGLFAKLPGIKYLATGGKKVAGFFKTILGLFSKIPGMTSVLKGIVKGFKILGWPITILFGLFDFIKAFRSTEGGILDKIKGGLKGALMGFFEMPVRMIGWLIEKTLGLFGVESTGVADKMVAGLKAGLDWIVDVFMWPVRFIQTFFSTEGFIFDKLGAALKGAVKSIFTLPVKIVGWLVDKILGWFGVSIEGGSASVIMKGMNDYIDGLIEYWTGIWDSIKNIWTSVKKLWNFFTEDESGKSIWEKIYDKLKGIPGMIKDWFLGLIPGKETFKKGWKSIKDFWSGGDEKGDVSAMDSIMGGLDVTSQPETKRIQPPTLDEKVPPETKRIQTPTLDDFGPDTGQVYTQQQLVEEARALQNTRKAQTSIIKDEPVHTIDKVAVIEAQKAKMMKDDKQQTVQANEKLIHEQAKTRDVLVKENKEQTGNLINTVNSTSNTNNNTSSNMDDIADEIDNFGILFMNKCMV